MTELKSYDVVLIGGGIMSATLGTLLRAVSPEKSILLIERLEDIALESSNPWNNAGTGHAALCELNYMPDSKDGSLPDPTKAIAINEQFQLSRQFWSTLVESGTLGEPSTFIHAIPHMTFVRGEKDVDYLRRRFEALKAQPLFKGMEFTTDPEKIKSWAPLLIEGRNTNEPVAATRIETGTDVDFGAITRQLVAGLQSSGAEIKLGTEVRSLKRTAGGWLVRTNSNEPGFKEIRASFVFVGAGGWALKLLQKAGIPEVSGYGTFPVGGQWLRTSNPEVIAKHHAKVYSQASVGAPPMSVPHLDTRVVDGKTSLLFGPYATSNPKFLKRGSVLDLPASLRAGNLIPYIAVGLSNLGLIKYLVGELIKTKARKFASLKEFMPTAMPEDWELLDAGQRAQIIKRDAKSGGVLQFGTEIITSQDGTISGLLGASPGASTAVYAMLQVLKAAFKDEYPAWEPALKRLMPELGQSLNNEPKLAEISLARTARILGIK